MGRSELLHVLLCVVVGTGAGTLLAFAVAGAWTVTPTVLPTPVLPVGMLGLGAAGLTALVWLAALPGLRAHDASPSHRLREGAS